MVLLEITLEAPGLKYIIGIQSVHVTQTEVECTQDKKRAMYNELKGQILSWPSRGLTIPYLKALLSNLELLESQIIWPFKELRANLAL